jgi:hypothetical protein
MYRKIPVFSGFCRRDVIDFVKIKLRTDFNWARKAVIELYKITKKNELDRKGFSIWDRPFFTYWYSKIIENKSINGKLEKEIHRRIAKYATQIITISDYRKLNILLRKYYVIN